MWWDDAGLGKRELKSPMLLSHPTTGSDCLMGTTARDKFRASPSLPALEKELCSAKIYFYSRDHETIQCWHKQHQLIDMWKHMLWEAR